MKKKQFVKIVTSLVRVLLKQKQFVKIVTSLVRVLLKLTCSCICFIIRKTRYSEPIEN